MPVAVTHWLYQFDELSDSAKEAAREWWRSVALDHGWWDSVYEDAVRIGKILGIEISSSSRHGSGRELSIWFSGFSSQGDGACWEGSYRYAKGWRKTLESEAPAGYKAGKPDGTEEWVYSESNAELHRIGRALHVAQARQFYKLTASSTHRGRYNHSGCMDIDVEHDEGRYRDIGDAEDEIKDALRDFADWIYKSLEKAHDWLLSDEQVDEAIRANEYTFNEAGRREDCP